jgi:hypothetical protein
VGVLVFIAAAILVALLAVTLMGQRAHISLSSKARTGRQVGLLPFPSLVSVWIDSFVYSDCDQDNHAAHGVLNVRRDQKDIHQIAQRGEQ